MVPLSRSSKKGRDPAVAVFLQSTFRHLLPHAHGERQRLSLLSSGLGPAMR